MIDADVLPKAAHNRFRRLFRFTLQSGECWRVSRDLLFQCQEDALLCQSKPIHNDHAMG